jgi:SM-20-related protein
MADLSVRQKWWSSRPGPYYLMADLLPAATAEEVLSQILNREVDFCPLTGQRNFLRLPQPLDCLPAFSDRVLATLPHIQRVFGVALCQPEIEFYVHAYNDGTRFGRHADDHGGGNWRRRISCVYYVHRRPRAFEGGDLIVYDHRGRAHRVRAEHNTAVFFPSHLLHEVQPVICRSGAFADSRFSINVWIM